MSWLNLESIFRKNGGRPAPKLSWQELACRAERRFPQLWRISYPRMYGGVGAYHSPRELATHLVSVLAAYGDTKMQDEALASDALCASKLVELQVPMFFISPTLLAAIQQTRPPDEVAWPETPLPFHTAAFMLPRGALRHSSEGEASYLVYSRWTKDETVPIAGTKKVVTVGDDIFYLQTACLESTPAGFQRSYVRRKTPVLNLMDLDTMGCQTSDGSLSLVGDDKDFMNAVVSLTFGILLVMLARPQLVERGHATGSRTKHTVETWSPNVIGARYQVLRQGGEHCGISPRMHWRRGHWRSQPYGPGHGLRRDQWIEPMLVAVEARGEQRFPGSDVQDLKGLAVPKGAA